MTFTDAALALLPGYTSPTLTFAVSGNANDATAKLLILRPEDAYNQYASSGASKGTASMISNIADSLGVVTGDMKNLIGTIDFSDGRLLQLLWNSSQVNPPKASVKQPLRGNKA